MSDALRPIPVGDLINPENLTVEFDVFYSYNTFGRDVRMFRHAHDAKWIAKPVEWTRIQRGESIPATFNLQAEQDAQNLMDALWKSGVRPSNGEGNVGMIGAMKEHIADLREDVKFHRAQEGRRLML